MLGRVLEGQHFDRARQTFFSIRGFLERAASTGVTILPTLFAMAEPGPPVDRQSFETLMEQLLAHLRRHMPFDALYLDLHGAMVVKGFEDGELEITRRVREMIGDLPFVASLDLHGNISEEFFNLCDGLVGYREFPHVDSVQVGARAFDLIHWILHTGRRPARAFRRTDFLIPTSCQGTAYEPARAFYDHIRAAEASDPELLSMSLMLGFVPADIHCCGPSLFSYATTQIAADRNADALLEQIAAREAECRCRMVSLDEAVSIAMAVDKGRLVLADAQDNPGGGGSADTMFIVRALARKNVKGVLVGMIHDPEAVAAAQVAGEGSTVRLALGGRSVEKDEPFRADFVVERYLENPLAHLDGPMMNGTRASLGPTAILRAGGIQLLVNSKRLQCLDRGYFRAAGLNPEEARILVLKSTLHYEADFREIAGNMVMVKAPGHYRMDPLDNLHNYRRLPDGMKLCGNGPRFRRPMS